HDGEAGRGVAFSDVTEFARPLTYQVWRAEFDNILLTRAKEIGVDVREGCRVTACDFAADGATLEFARQPGASERVRVRAVVDATGREGLIARKYKLRTDEP